MFKTLSFGLVIALGGVFSMPSFGLPQQAPSEASCAQKQDMEACFYAGVEYIQGEGVAKNVDKAHAHFLKSCDLGLPDGCNVLGYEFQYGPNTGKNIDKAIGYYTRACSMNFPDACHAADKILVDQRKDWVNALNLWEVGCLKSNMAKMCEWSLSHLMNGERDTPIDRDRAAPIARHGCMQQSKAACETAEILHAVEDSPQFDAAEAMRFLGINCIQGNWMSCRGLAGIYRSLEMWDKTTFFYQRACDIHQQKTGTDSEDCAAASDFAQYEKDLAEYEAYQAELVRLNTQLNDLLRARDYAGATRLAISERSVDLSDQAVRSIQASNGWQALSNDDLYIFANWLSGTALDYVNAEMKRRGTGLQGQFGEGTNTMRAIAQRMGQPSLTSAPRSSGSVATMPATKSSAQISKETREKYRFVNCQMAGSAGGYKVCRN